MLILFQLMTKDGSVTRKRIQRERYFDGYPLMTEIRANLFGTDGLPVLVHGFCSTHSSERGWEQKVEHNYGAAEYVIIFPYLALIDGS